MLLHRARAGKKDSRPVKLLHSTRAGKDTEIDNLSIGNSFSASKFIQDRLTLPATKARTLYGAHFERDESGNVVGYNKPAGVEGRAPLVDGNGANLAFDIAFEKIIDGDPDTLAIYEGPIEEDEKMQAYQTTRQGGGLNATGLVAVARLGGNCVMIGCVGNDTFGEPLLNNLREEGIDCAGVTVTEDAPSGVAMIVVDSKGENSIVVASGANHLVTPDARQPFISGMNTTETPASAQRSIILSKK